MSRYLDLGVLFILQNRFIKDFKNQFFSNVSDVFLDIKANSNQHELIFTISNETFKIALKKPFLYRFMIPDKYKDKEYEMVEYFNDFLVNQEIDVFGVKPEMDSKQWHIKYGFFDVAVPLGKKTKVIYNWLKMLKEYANDGYHFDQFMNLNILFSSICYQTDYRLDDSKASLRIFLNESFLFSIIDEQDVMTFIDLLNANSSYVKNIHSRILSKITTLEDDSKVFHNSKIKFNNFSLFYKIDRLNNDSPYCFVLDEDKFYFDSLEEMNEKVEDIIEISYRSKRLESLF